MHRISLSEAAARELDDACHWYESRRVGFGDELLGQFLDVARRIGENPRLYPVVEDSLRRAVLPRFPYCIYYTTRHDHVAVLAFFHGKRSPKGWRERV